MLKLIIAASVGICVGIIVGLLGAGGGILSIPILVYILGQNPHQAAFASLVIVLFTAATALPGHVKQKHVLWKHGTLFGLISIIGAIIGTRLNLWANPTTLMLTFSALLLIVSILMGKKSLDNRTEPQETFNTQQELSPKIEKKIKETAKWKIIVAALITGILTGFFGIGGGFMVVPMLFIVFKLDVKQAVGTSLLIMIIAATVSLAARIDGAITPNWSIVTVFALASMIGGAAGAPLARRAPESLLSGIFATLLLIVALTTGITTIVNA